MPVAGMHTDSPLEMNGWMDGRTDGRTSAAGTRRALGLLAQWVQLPFATCVEASVQVLAEQFPV